MQLKVKQETGATVITKGTWLPDRTKASDKEPALYLHITGTTQEIVDAGAAMVERLLAQEMAPLVTDFRTRRQEEQQERAPRERRKWPEEHIPVGLESLRNFNVRAKIVGPQGLFVKFIQQETSARVQIKGIGSGFIEQDTGRESDEPMHIHIAAPEQIMVDKAKDLADDLLVVVREKWAEAKAVLDAGQQQQFGGQGGYPGGQYGQPAPPAYGAPPPPDGSYPAPPGQAPPPPVSVMRVFLSVGISHKGSLPLSAQLKIVSVISCLPQPDGSAPPPPPGASGQAQPPPPPAPSGATPAGAGGDVVAQAQAMAPTIDRSILEFYAGRKSPMLSLFLRYLTCYPGVRTPNDL